MPKLKTLFERINALGYVWDDPWSNAARTLATKDGKSYTAGDLITELLDHLEARKAPSILLIMDGGIVHEIIGDVPVDVTMLDYDSDGAGDDEVIPLPRKGYGERCFHISRFAEVKPAEVESLLAAIEKHWRDNSVTGRCTTCDAPVTPSDPYHATPCGTYCGECMEKHAKECGVCAHEFNLPGPK